MSVRKKTRTCNLYPGRKCKGATCPLWDEIYSESPYDYCEVAYDMTERLEARNRGEEINPLDLEDINEWESRLKRNNLRDGNISNIIQEIKDTVAERELSQRELTELCGVSQGQISQFLSSKTDARLSTLVSILTALDKTLAIVDI